MADVLNLALADYTDTASKVDLLHGVLRLRRGGYQPRTAASNGRVVETLSLAGEGTAAELTAAEEAIHELLQRAREWAANPLERDSVWLEWSTDGEPGAGTYASKRALIYGGTLQLANADGMRGGFLDAAMYADLAIERAAEWEDVEVSVTYLTTGLSAWGGEYDLDALSIPTGTLPSRIERLRCYSATAALYTWWIGIRDLLNGLDDFDPTWELELGTAGTDTATANSDATASNSNKMVCTFSTTETLASRVSITIEDALGGPGAFDYENYAGRYLVLLRCKLSAASTTCGIIMYHGMANQPAYGRAEEVFVDNTSWLLVELGEISIPPDSYRYPLAYWTAIQDFTITLYAERLEGSGSLELDALCLIPSEHMVRADQVASSATPDLSVYTIEDGEIVCRAEESSTPESSPEFAVVGWELPREPGVLVLAAQGSSSHSLTATVSLYIKAVHRYRLYHT